jgi:D-alanyl-D-alanine dipeptidase
MLKKSFYLIFIVLLSLVCPYCIAAQENALPDGFVYVDETIPGIALELRYYSNHNFIGERVEGYMAPKCILTKEAAAALRGVEEELRAFGLGLKIFDAYRPQQAVNHFVRWAKDSEDVRMKQEFYPKVAKENLFNEGYISAKSGHSRGSTVDLTIIECDAKSPSSELDMGTGFDFFGPQSWPDNPEIGAVPRAHRLLLREVMVKHGFKPYEKEWWHFTLSAEPYPDTYFNFPVH